MTTRLILLFIIACIGVGIATPDAMAQQPQRRFGLSRAALDSIVNPPLWDKGHLILKCDTTEINFGTITELDAPVALSYSLTNVSPVEVEITQLRAGCGCTAAKASKQHVGVGETVAVSVTFNPYNKVGKVNERIYLFTDTNPKLPTAILRVVGVVTEGKEK